MVVIYWADCDLKPKINLEILKITLYYWKPSSGEAKYYTLSQEFKANEIFPGVFKILLQKLLHVYQIFLIKLI